MEVGPVVVLSLSVSQTQVPLDGKLLQPGPHQGLSCCQVRPPDPLSARGFHRALQRGQDHLALLLPAGQG